MTFDMNDPAEVDRFLTYCSEEVGMEQLLDRDVVGMLIQLAARGNDSGPWFSSVVHECCEKATIQQDRADALEKVLRGLSDEEDERVHISVRAEIDQALAYIINDDDVEEVR